MTFYSRTHHSLLVLLKESHVFNPDNSAGHGTRTLAEAKAHLRVTHGDDDAYISTLIKTARQSIEAQTGLGLISQGWSVFLDDWPDNGVIELPLAPILDIADIKVYGDDDTFAVIDPAHYYEDKASRPARIILRGSRSWVAPGSRGQWH